MPAWRHLPCAGDHSVLTPCCVGVLNREDGEEEDAGEVEEEGEEAAE